MILDRVPAGKDIPNDFNVIIEIPAAGAPIKYELDKDTGAMFVDRFMGTAMFYPANYGYVPQTLSEDGDPVDVLVVTPFPLQVGVVVRCLIYNGPRRRAALAWRRRCRPSPEPSPTCPFPGLCSARRSG